MLLAEETDIFSGRSNTCWARTLSTLKVQKHGLEVCEKKRLNLSTDAQEIASILIFHCICNPQVLTFCQGDSSFALHLKKIIGVLLIKFYRFQVFSTSSVYCVVYFPPKVKFSSVTIYLTPLYPSLSWPPLSYLASASSQLASQPCNFYFIMI